MPHLVYASVSDADRATGVPHFDSKYQVEKYIQGLDIPWTVVAPAYFFDNVLFPWNIADLKEGRYRQPLPTGRGLQQISKVDIGRFNALVIEKREPFLGQRINIAGDEVTCRDAATALSKAIGRGIEYVEQPIAEVARAIRRPRSDVRMLRSRWLFRRHRRAAPRLPGGWLDVVRGLGYSQGLAGYTGGSGVAPTA